MPLGMTVPTWYNDNHYISEKVDECNTIKFGAVEGEEFTPWTEASVRDFMAAANGEASYAPWMGYDNFVTNGNAENVSPNPLFDVMQYVTAKAAQLNSINYDGRNADTNPWTAQNVLDFFNAHNITAWDHFTTAGQFEDVNPSNAMDLSDFLVNKAKQCNDMGFDGKSDWDSDAVLAYYQEHGLNAVMVAVNASDPNVVAVPQADQVTPPVGFTPWGVAVTPVDVELTTGIDVMPASEAPINYIGTLANTNANSTLNYGDQINGGNEADELTVNMDRQWTGFDDKGYVKDIPTINLNNDTVSGRNLTFNANNIEGADTWNVDGNVSLSNLAEAGITVNLANVNANNVIDLGFDADAVSGGNDSLTIGLDNVKASGIGANGIEHVTINATGEASSAPLKYLVGSTSLTVTGDADVSFGNVAPTIKTVDMSEATGDNFVCTRRADLIESVILGQGDDSVSLRSLLPNAVIMGGDGNDKASLVSTAGSYQLQMESVETLAVNVKTNFDDQVPTIGQPSGSASLALDGGMTTGLQTLALGGGNGYNPVTGAQTYARPISLTNYNEGQLTVAVTGKNNVDLGISDIQDIIVNVGDGKATDAANNVPLDYLTGTVTLPDAQSVAINITDLNNPGKAETEFNAAVYAENASNLSLASGQYAGMIINGGDLSAVSQLTISGYYDTTVSNAALAQDVKNVHVDAQGQIGGSVTTSFTGNAYATKGGATLDYNGSVTGKNNVTVDGSYTTINIDTGVNDDTITLTGNEFTKYNLTGNLGDGTNTLVLEGSNVTGDLRGLAGVTNYNFKGMTTAQVQAAIESGDLQITKGVNWQAYTGGETAPEYVPVAPGQTTQIPSTTVPDAPVFIQQTDVSDPTAESTVEGKPGQTNSYVGSINNSTTITGNAGEGSANQAGVDITFGTAAEANNGTALNVGDVPNLNLVGGTDPENPNTFEGTINSTTNKATNTNITTGTANDTVNLNVAQNASQTTTIDNAAGAGIDSLVNSGAGTLDYTGDASDGISATGSGATNITATGATTAMNNSGTGTMTADLTGTSATQTVTLAGADGSGAASGENVINTQAVPTVKVEGSAADLTINAGKDTTTVSLAEDAGTASLEISNDAGGDLTITSTGPTKTHNGVTWNNGNQTDLAIHGQGDTGTINLGTDPQQQTGGGSYLATDAFTKMESLTITGSQDVNIKAQIGGFKIPVLTVDASGADGDLTSVQMLNAQAIKYTGSDGVDTFTAAPGGTGSVIDLGKGADEVTFNNYAGYDLGTVTPNFSGNFATSTIDLGSDTDIDQLHLYSGGSYKGAKIDVINWTKGTDTIDTKDVDNGSYWGVSMTIADIGKAQTALALFGITDTATVAEDSNVAYVGTTAYVFVQAGDTQNGVETLTDANGIFLIGIQNAQTGLTADDIIVPESA